jgi:hypothetical protein
MTAVMIKDAVDPCVDVSMTGFGLPREGTRDGPISSIRRCVALRVFPLSSFPPSSLFLSFTFRSVPYSSLSSLLVYAIAIVIQSNPPQPSSASPSSPIKTTRPHRPAQVPRVPALERRDPHRGRFADEPSRVPRAGQRELRHGE